MATSMFGSFAAVFPALPYALHFVEEYNTSYFRFILVRSSRRKYAVQNVIHVSVSGGSITLDVYKQKRGAVDRELAALAAEQDSLKAVADPEPFESVVAAFIEEAGELAGQTELTRQMVEKMVETVYIYGDNRMEVKFRFEDAVKTIVEQVN